MKYFLFCVLPVFFTIFFPGCGKEEVKKEIPPRPVQTAIAAKKDVPFFIDSFGYINVVYNVNIETTKINLGYCDIISPVDGITSKRFVDPGNIVPANTGPTLVNIRSIDPMYMDFNISEAELDRVRSAMDSDRLILGIEKEAVVQPFTSSSINTSLDLFVRKHFRQANLGMYNFAIRSRFTRPTACLPGQLPMRHLLHSHQPRFPLQSFL